MTVNFVLQQQMFSCNMIHERPNPISTMSRELLPAETAEMQHTAQSAHITRAFLSFSLSQEIENDAEHYPDLLLSHARDYNKQYNFLQQITAES